MPELYIGEIQLEVLDAPNPRLAGRLQTATGYGRKLSTPYKVRKPGSKVWKRVYCCCFSNSGTLYTLNKGLWEIVRGCPRKD